MKRVVLFMMLALGPALLTGLIGCGDGCRGSSYRIDTYQLDLFRNEKTRPDQSTVSRVSANDTIPYQKLELQLLAKPIFVSQVTAGGSSLMACDPVNSPLDKLKAMTITSDQPYSAGLPAGTNLAPFIHIFPYDGAYTQSVTNYLATAARFANDRIILQLQVAPDQIVRHRFTITVELDNGRQLTSVSAPVFVIP
ncbi:hypothetical protein [Fibrella aestuarina]|uniref:hypothetical protein n=1 Tax=Fibrella aestuarina TaxID=651143 RepID=UPI00059E077A|nr:hypothetical protein [Fibrella aestuarina]